MTLQSRIDNVETLIAAACARSGRSREDVQVIAVTKYVSLETTCNAFSHGLNQLGENRWQDAKEKWQYLSGDKPEDASTPIWHFIGSLQTNKAKDVVGRFPYIHSLDRLSLAQAIAKKAKDLQVTVKCLVQVNVSGEESKHGVSPAELPQLLHELQSFPELELVGLMTMAPLDADAEQARPFFRRLRELRDEIRQQAGYESLQELSMGMSGDFEVAIEEGATFVRLGTILVGKEGDAE